MTTPLTGPFSLSMTKNFIAASVFVGAIFDAFAPCAPLAASESRSTNSPASRLARAMVPTAIDHEVMDGTPSVGKRPYRDAITSLGFVLLRSAAGLAAHAESPASQARMPAAASEATSGRAAQLMDFGNAPRQQRGPHRGILPLRAQRQHERHEDTGAREDRTRESDDSRHPCGEMPATKATGNSRSEYRGDAAPTGDAQDCQKGGRFARPIRQLRTDSDVASRAKPVQVRRWRPHRWRAAQHPSR